MKRTPARRNNLATRRDVVRRGSRVRPEFVMLGAQHAPQQFVLFGSQSIHAFDINRQQDFVDITEFSSATKMWVPGLSSADLHCYMSDMRSAFGASYFECLQKLFANWSGDQPRLPSGQ